MQLIRLAILLAGLAGAVLAQPRRIISTAPSITEMLFALGAGDRVVGVTRFCNYPAQARNIAKIGDYLQPNVEVILGLKPDLVIIEESPLHRDRFTALGLKTLAVRFETVSDIYESLRKIGTAVGAPARATQVVAGIEQQLQAIRARVAGRPRATLLFLVGRTPNSLEGMVAAGNAPYLNQVFEIAGGTNAFRDSSMRYFRIPNEQILARNPQFIFDMGDMADTSGVTEQHKAAVVNLWKQRMPELDAVRQHHVFAIASDIYVVPGPRVVDAAREFARMLHPEAFR